MHKPPHSPIALVTGGSRGLGRSTVLALAARGVSSLFTYHTRYDEARHVIDAARQAGADALALPLDTGACDTFGAFAVSVQQALTGWGADRLDYLVNNAGIAHHSTLAQTTEQALDRLFAVNFKGVFFLTQTLLPLLNDGGRIVNISSGLTRFCVPQSGPYAALKGALEVLTRYQAQELGPRRITVNTVAPGAIQTDFSNGRVRDNPEVNAFVAGATALGRAGVPEDIGPLIAALLSEAGRWVNAQRIEASGGMFL
ncbi:3-oxoacyl-ACP reductase [Chimaeribacter arupi]|uniref:SDR family NAD(P)-dependent oxidoreductase n=1 Tax=Chimaeribacter arupi TaxID=2060066 RepID=UPI000C7A4D4A|nr:SDR family oxidoreductase [Chimaeribacter arupi]PLR47504.1 3-oxoacyl-ACP reductase [Chimaeribacter arupi]